MEFGSLPFWASCAKCQHTWVVAYYPCPVEQFARIARHAICPKCGGKAMVARQEGGRLLKPSEASDPPEYKVGDIVPLHFRNTGNSYGLEYPYIFAKVGRRWVVWHRDTGSVAWVNGDGKFSDALHRYDAEKACRQLNHMTEPTAEQRAAINAAHDEEA